MNKKTNFKTIAFFDYDDTISFGDSLLYWQAWVFRHYPLWRFFLIVNWIAILFCALKLIKPAFLKRVLLVPSAYLSSAKRDKLAKDFCEKRLRSRIYPEMADTIKTHHSLGHEIVIISASSEFYLQYIGEFFCQAKIIGTKVHFPSSGWFRLPFFDSQFGNMKKAIKVKAIKCLFGSPAHTSKTYAYSDSISDRFLLDYVDNPVCINPNPPLLKLSKKKNWPVFYISRTDSYWRITIIKALMLVLGMDIKSKTSLISKNSDYLKYLETIK